MLRPRIIPCLLIHRGGLVKTVKFEKPRYVGDPINAVKIFNEKEADELVVLDIDATVSGSEPNYSLIADLAAECRMPLCYGGGVRTTQQARKIISLGVEKVAVSSAAVARPSLVAEIAREAGAQSAVVILDTRKSGGRYGVWTHNGRRDTGRSVFDLSRQLADEGAGEIVVNSIDDDGQMQGYDVDLAERVRSLVDVPLTVLGGAGHYDDLRRLFSRCGVVGAAAGSLFVFKGTYRAVLISYPNRKQKDDLFTAAVGEERPA